MLNNRVKDLVCAHPELLAEWDFEKNGELSPGVITANSSKKIWWKCSIGHEWKVSPNSRTSQKSGCPYCSNRRALPGFNDLATTNPDVAKEWNYDQNGGLKPTDVVFGSQKSVWWKCANGHEWKAVIASRTKGTGCPYCVGQRAIKGETDLQTLVPTVSAEWHPIKNGKLQPSDVKPGSNQKVWWKCSKGHEWQATVASRAGARREKCPYCSNKRVLSGFNDIATTHLELCKEWNYERNKDLNPSDITYGSTKKIWWKCQYGHEWQASLNTRSRGRGCPKCSGNGSSLPEQGIAFYLEQVCKIEQRVKIKKQEVDIYLPDYKIGIEYDGRFYHKTESIEKERNKDKILSSMGIMVVRIKESDSNTTDKGLICYKVDDMQSNYEWAIHQLFILLDLVTGNNHFCSVVVDVQKDLINIRGRFALYNKERSLLSAYPALAKEWDYGKNGELKPDMFPLGSHMNVWWKCSKGHEWKAAIKTRAKGFGCPCCAGQRVIVGVNDLETVFPDIAVEWHQTKNGDLKPSDVMPKSNKMVWWLGKCGHEWNVAVIQRTAGNTCPYCSNKKVLLGFNDLVTTHPDIAKEWHPTKNDDLMPTDITARSSKLVWWICSKGHEWVDRTNHRISQKSCCPYCSGVKKRVLNIDTGKTFNSIVEAARSCGMKSGATISLCCRGKLQTAGGFHWKYCDE